MVLGDRPLMYRFVLDRASPEWLDDWDDVVLGDAAGMVREGYVCNINKAKSPISTIVWAASTTTWQIKNGRLDPLQSQQENIGRQFVN